jgi:hypothetical protein
MDSLTVISWIALHRKSAASIACAVGIAVTTGKWYRETDQARVQRGQRKREKELRALADKISTYGRKVHQRYPTGDVVVDETDLAQQLHSRPDTVADALNILMGEEKAQRVPLNGYWKLNA